MDDKESSFIGLVGLMGKLRGEKKLLFEENLDKCLSHYLLVFQNAKMEEE